MENSKESPQKIKTELPYYPAIPLLGVYPKKVKKLIQKDICSQTVIAALFMMAKIQFSSVQFSRSVVSYSLRPHELQHARLPCPSPTPGVYSNSCPLSQWCHPTVSSSVILFSCLQPFPTSGSFQMSQLFASGGQNIGVSVSASVLPMNTQD